MTVRARENRDAEGGMGTGAGSGWVENVWERSVSKAAKYSIPRRKEHRGPPQGGQWHDIHRFCILRVC